jgi:hypothetical protein
MASSKVFVKIVEDVPKDRVITDKNFYIKANISTLGNSEVYRKYKYLIDEMKKPKTCTYCGKPYTAQQNYQHYSCWMHPGRHFYDKDGRIYYECCGDISSYNTLGCTPCMHTSSDQNRIFIIEQFRNTPVPREFVDSELIKMNKTMIATQDSQYYYFASNQAYVHSHVNKRSKRKIKLPK